MNAALIGYGYWGKIIEKYIASSKQFVLTAVYDLSPLDHPLFASVLSDVINDRSIEAAFVCTPVPTHFAICEAFLKNGKHVFCEKPATQTVAQFETLRGLAVGNSRIFFTDYIYIYSQSLRKMKEAIREIEPICFVHAAIRQFGKFYPGENTFNVIGLHMLSAILFLLEQYPDSISSTYNIAPHAGEITLEFSMGISARIESSLLSPYRERKLTVYGKNGILMFDMNADDTLTQYKYENNGHELAQSAVWRLDEKNNLAFSVEEFAKRIHADDASENSDISGMVQKILEALE